MLNTTLIVRNREFNPHRRGSLDARRWALLVSGMTVGDFVAAHNGFGPLGAGPTHDPAVGELGGEWHAKRYLKVMVERGWLTLPGYTFVRRGPRVAITTPLATDLDAFSFGPEIECFL